MTRNIYGDIGIIVLVSVCMIFFNLDAFSLLDPDEPVYAQTAKEMLAQGSFISPLIYGDFWYDKPPMYYWLIMGAVQLFGMGEFAARFPSALLGVMGCLSLYFSAKDIFNRRTAFISALILATSFEYFYLAKAAVTDITLTLFISASLLAFIQKRYYLFYFSMGLAVLTKGPIGFFPAVIGFVYLICSGRLGELKHSRLFSGSLLMFLVFAPWYGAMIYFHGHDFVDTFLGFHNITRFTSPEHPSKTMWYFYLPVLLIGFFPWCAVLPQALWRAFTSGAREQGKLLFFSLWAGLVFVFFSVAQTKLVSYILPMYPPMAILVGWYINSLWEDFYRTERFYGWIATLLLLSAGFSYGTWQGLKALPGMELTAICLIFVLLFIGIFAACFLWKRQAANAFFLQIIGMFGLAAVVSGMLVPAVAPQFSSEAVALELKTSYNGQDIVYISKFLRPGIAFYGDIYGEELVFSATQIPDMEQLLAKNPSAYFILRDIDYKRLSPTVRQKLLLVKRADNNLILQGIMENTP